MLTKKEKQILLSVARISIEDAVNGTNSNLPEQVTPALGEKCGAFVTLHRRGELRGCIGYIEGFMPLIETVAEVASKAALEDPRFPHVATDELNEIEIEISALSPLKLIKDASEVEVGKHGIVIQNGPYRGLLLPQVATEYNWDRETFLSQTCRKAGLSQEKWKDPQTKIHIFSADIFSEKKS